MKVGQSGGRLAAGTVSTVSGQSKNGLQSGEWCE